MGKYKAIPQNYLQQLTLRFERNLYANCNEHVADRDFFALIGKNFNRDVGVDLIKIAFTESELNALAKHSNSKRLLDTDDDLTEILAVLWNEPGLRKKCRCVVESMIDAMMDSCASGDNDRMKARFEELRRVLKLSDLELEIAQIAYLVSEMDFCWPRRITNHEKPTYYAMAIDRSVGEVVKALAPEGRLRKFSYLDEDWDFDRRSFRSFLDGSDNEAIERRFYVKKDVSSALPWKFYGDQVKRDGELIKELIDSSEGKCNILFYGAPGTGKTSLAYSLARELGRNALEIRQGDKDGSDMRTSSRMVGIHIANEQEDPRESLIIVDEADKILRSAGGEGAFGMFAPLPSTEKGLVNSVLDNMKMPVIWISNVSSESIDESIRRRFDYSVHFDSMTNTQRVSVWRNLIKGYGLVNLIPEEKLPEYAMKYQTSAGGISTVLGNVKRIAPKKDRVDELIAALMKPHCELMGLVDHSKFVPAKGYQLDGLNVKGKVSPKKVLKAIRNFCDVKYNAVSEDRPRMNILMYGPPGTGKTEFVKFIGHELGKKVRVVKGSDLLAKWVGESEKNIANAFRCAEREGAILFFDEIDGLVQARENAHASWEISQVNELLQQMENFNGVMIAATNFCKNLDPAIMRRFTFKFEFDYLDDEGKKSFFERYFKTTLTEDELGELKTLRNLAPGDFRTVRQEMFYLNESQTNEDFIAALREECLLKLDGERSAKIGFHT